MHNYLLFIAAVVFALDGFTKWWVKTTIPVDTSINVIPGLFRLTHLENRGVAFSMFADSPGPWPNRLLVLVSFAAVVLIGTLLWKRGQVMNRTTFSLALFLGGTLGNLYDRLTRGMVTDFLDFFVGSHHWPAFNVADSAIVVGVLLLISEILLPPQKEKVPGS
jgi:signal peptidase II